MSVAQKAGNLTAPIIIQWLEPPHYSQVTLTLFTLGMHKLTMMNNKTPSLCTCILPVS